MGSTEEKLDNRQLLILYASQTGNAMDAAEHLGREAERRGCPSVSVLSMDEFQPVCSYCSSGNRPGFIPLTLDLVVEL